MRHKSTIYYQVIFMSPIIHDPLRHFSLNITNHALSCIAEMTRIIYLLSSIRVFSDVRCTEINLTHARIEISVISPLTCVYFPSTRSINALAAE